MIDSVLVGAAVLAGLLCPLHMWFSDRRGQQSVCCLPTRKSHGAGDVEELRERQQRLAAMIAEHDRKVLTAPTDGASVEV
jgi:hypothetical protein